MRKILSLVLIFIVSFATKSYASDHECDVGLNFARRNIRFISKQFVIDQHHGFDNSIIFGVPVSDLGLEYYYRVKDQDELSIKDDDIEKISNAVVAKLIEKLALPTKPENPGVEPTPDNPDQPIVPEPEPESPVEQLKLSALNILKKNCAKCHSGDTINGGLEIVKDGKLAQLNREQKFDIFIATFDQKMPKGGDPLSDEDVIVLKEWAKLK